MIERLHKQKCSFESTASVGIRLIGGMLGQVFIVASLGDFMPVSGIVVSCLDGSADAVSARIAAFAGVELHGVLPDGQIVAVIEADTVEAEVKLVSQLHEVEDVVTVRLAYHNFEDL